MLNTLIEAFRLISTWEVIIAMFAASVYGLVIGSLPGLSATMATALLVPVTFYLSPIAAIATIAAISAAAASPGASDWATSSASAVRSSPIDV